MVRWKNNGPVRIQIFVWWGLKLTQFNWVMAYVLTWCGIMTQSIVWIKNSSLTWRYIGYTMMLRDLALTRRMELFWTRFSVCRNLLCWWTQWFLTIILGRSAIFSCWYVSRLACANFTIRFIHIRRNIIFTGNIILCNFCLLLFYVFLCNLNIRASGFWIVHSFPFKVFLIIVVIWWFKIKSVYF